jgi:FkbM family methyltransferase
MFQFYSFIRKLLPTDTLSLLRSFALIRRISAIIGPKELQHVRLGGNLQGYQMFLPRKWVYSMGQGNYEPDTMQAVAQYVKKGMRVIDVGSHIGYVTLLCRKYIGEQGEIICFEPLAENRKILYENLRLNHLDSTIRVEPLALSDKLSLMVLHKGEHNALATLQQHNWVDRGSQVTPTCDLDSYLELLNWPRIDFVKIDIEGEESAAIRGMQQTLARFYPTILLEVHREYARDGINILFQHNYQFIRYVDNKPVKVDSVPRELGHERWIAYNELSILYNSA